MDNCLCIHMSGISVTWTHNRQRAHHSAGQPNGATQGKMASIKAKGGPLGPMSRPGRVLLGCFWLHFCARWLDAARLQALAGPVGKRAGSIVPSSSLLPPPPPAVRFNTAHANPQPPVVGRRNFTPPAARPPPPVGAPSVALKFICLAMPLECPALPN